MARMRYPAQALELLRQEDPDTCVSLNFIRALAASGKIPVVKIGRRRLINYDSLVEFLANPDMQKMQIEQVGKIRKVCGGEHYGSRNGY